MNIKLLKCAIQMSNMPRVIIAQIAVITLFFTLANDEQMFYNIE